MQNENKIYYCKGIRHYGDRVIQALKAKGGIVDSLLRGNDPDKIYYFRPNERVLWTTKGVIDYQLVTTHPNAEEIFPEPDFKFKVGDRVMLSGEEYTVGGLVNINGFPFYNIKEQGSVSENLLTLSTKVKTWDELEEKGIKISGYYIGALSTIIQACPDTVANANNKNIASSEEVAKSMLAMAQISQLMPYYGGVVSEKEWKHTTKPKYVIIKEEGRVRLTNYGAVWCFLAFHREEQRDKFYLENRQLVYDFLMIKQDEV